MYPTGILPLYGCFEPRPQLEQAGTTTPWYVGGCRGEMVDPITAPGRSRRQGKADKGAEIRI